MRDKRSSKDRMSGQRSLKSEKSGEGKINGLATHVGSGRHNHKHSAHVEDPVKTITFPAEVQLFKSLEGNRTLSTHSVTPISDCKPGQKIDLPITRTMRQIPHAKQPHERSAMLRAVKSFAAGVQTAPEQLPNKLKDDLD
eukprot:CAMPEP_0198220948 /NCGR_PEP_ID=MMETSP1445-20131203/81468_1 /TAXON_ID=36898 /ORGANISM="Pyramimonas sp., Strain CCMP2087" /LENGTH=139 /DNA_ID=CAMNT_0043898897 /DNA_START=241 /DNA_END=657 /DNA_ORIENTATION=-